MVHNFKKHVCGNNFANSHLIGIFAKNYYFCRQIPETKYIFVIKAEVLNLPESVPKTT